MSIANLCEGLVLSFKLADSLLQGGDLCTKVLRNWGLITKWGPLTSSNGIKRVKSFKFWEFLNTSTIFWYCDTWKSTFRTFALRLTLIFFALGMYGLKESKSKSKSKFTHLSAYFSVLKVSSNVSAEGDTLAIMTVLQLPPIESFSNLVSFEFLVS